MLSAPRLDDRATASTRRVASASLRALAVAVDLLDEAARTLGPGPGSAAIHEAVGVASGRVPRLEDSRRGAADTVVAAAEVARLCDLVASRCRQTSPAALGGARMAETSARLALEALTEDRGWTGAEALSRRARQVGEIQDLRDRLAEMAASLAVHGVEVSPGGG